MVFCRTINQIVDCFFFVFFPLVFFLKISFLMLEYTQPFEVNNNNNDDRNLPVSLGVCAWVRVYM